MPPVLTHMLIIGFAGGLGALSRWGVSHFVHTLNPEARFHYGTLAVNVLGCLAFGYLIEIFAEQPDGSHWRSFFMIGFLGSFTTFSTFAHDTYLLHDRDGLIWAIGNIALNVLLGCGAVVLGILLGRAIS